MRFYDLLIETNRELVGEPDPGGNVDRSRFGYGKRYNGELSARSLSDPVRSPLQLVSLCFLSDFDSGYGFRYF